ncbi:hypothetical protein Mgra_00004029 [Meloidogyne graminicola]|uniref:Uncharacterized protein n=1 Tax=Meloidogyne graminicola TaxID=189291 RepID=A0A8S9ZTK5_9BILA|nr:hypothetical protein Mgra_00004029 [Meloidogyne graminicola]
MNGYLLNFFNSTSLAFPSSSFVPQTLSEHQNNNNSYNCPTCNNKINVFEKEKQQKQIIPPSSPSFEQKEKNLLKITSMPLPDRQNDGESSEDSGNNNHIKLLQHKLFEHYHTVAYTLVILTCFLAFCEYLYLRLASFIFPEPIIYRRKCEKHYNEVVYRNELHFASGLAIFLVMGIFQILCFFLLTISKKLLDVKRTTFSQVLSMEERLHNELVFAVRRTMFETLFPTFGIYLLCSSVIYCVIFYMVGLRDQIVHFGSSIIIYVFDACIILYFLAFPILCVIFHPEINCCRKSFSKICCCFTCVWQLQRRRRDRANAQQFGNRHFLIIKSKI